MRAQRYLTHHNEGSHVFGERTVFHLKTPLPIRKQKTLYCGSMLTNPIQFAVVREDPLVEKAVLERYPAKHMLIIASGGCTALALKAWHPELRITLLDPNPAALELIRKKVHALQSKAPAENFNIGNDDPAGLSQCGNFESLFRLFRRFIEEMVLSSNDLNEMFHDPNAFVAHRNRILNSPYWPIAFEWVFSESFLRQMFGDDALQYAPPGSYPTYFQKRFEWGLNQTDAIHNPFLHHIFLGKYLKTAQPAFLETPPTTPTFEWVEGHLDRVDFSNFDCIGLSNILDWTPPNEAQNLLTRLHTECKTGTTVLWRQLNNTRPLHEQLTPDFRFDHDWEKQLHQHDRSLFYSSVHVGHRINK